MKLMITQAEHGDALSPPSSQENEQPIRNDAIEVASTDNSATWWISLVADKWILTNGDEIMVEAVSSEDGKVQLTAFQMDQKLWHEAVNSEDSTTWIELEQNLVSEGITIPEDGIAALISALVTGEVPEHYRLSATEPVDFSEKNIGLEEISAQLAAYLNPVDSDVLPILLAAVAAHRSKGSTVWIMVIGASSSGKTELLTALSDLPEVYQISDLTAKTLASGYDGITNKSLLKALSGMIIVIKDFTTVLSMSQTARQNVFAQLREIYDGRFDKVWGNGQELHWMGRLGFLGAVTDAIDIHHEGLNALGPRFLFLRIRPQNRRVAAEKAIENQGLVTPWQGPLARKIADFMASVPRDRPKLDAATTSWLGHVADVVARSRSPVHRNNRSELQNVPSPEMPTRLVQQLQALLQGLLMVSRREVVTPIDKRRIARVGLDCIPPLRRMVLEILAVAGRPLSIADAEEHFVASRSTLRRTFEDLAALEVLRKHKPSKGKKADAWTIADEYQQLLFKMFNLTSFSENSIGIVGGPTDFVEQAETLAQSKARNNGAHHE